MSTRDVYRTNDGNAYFEFEFVKVGSKYQVDIVSQPSYGSRDSDLHLTHRLPSDRGGHRVCFADDDAVTSIGRAQKWVEAWAESTWRYINSGTNF